jgi:hypothetical protein
MKVAGEVVTSWKLEQRKHAILTFICLFITIMSLKMQRSLDLFISINCCTCFRRFLRPSSGARNCIYSVRYCQTNTAACCYRGWDGTNFHLIHDSSRQQYCFYITKILWRSMRIIFVRIPATLRYPRFNFFRSFSDSRAFIFRYLSHNAKAKLWFNGQFQHSLLQTIP